MAQVTSSTHQHIDIVLSHLLDAWMGLPNAVNEIDGWDLDRQIAYIEEWTPDEHLLDLLHEYNQEDVLTPDQSSRYQHLMDVVRDNRHLLDQLRAQ
jgi:hypothetical protein